MHHIAAGGVSPGGIAGCAVDDVDAVVVGTGYDIILIVAIHVTHRHCVDFTTGGISPNLRTVGTVESMNFHIRRRTRYHQVEYGVAIDVTKSHAVGIGCYRKRCTP